MPFETLRPVGNERLDELRRQVQGLGLLPPEAPLGPGADFGPFVGTIKGRRNTTGSDFVWEVKGTLFLRRGAVRQLEEQGVRLPRCGVPRLTPRPATQLSIDLVEPEAVGLIDVVNGSPGDPQALACPRCGRVPSSPSVFSAPTFHVSADVEIPEHVDLFRPRNRPAALVVTERFAAAVEALALTGGVLKPIPVVGKREQAVPR